MAVVMATAVVVVVVRPVFMVFVVVVAVAAFSFLRSRGHYVPLCGVCVFVKVPTHRIHLP